MLFCLPDLRDLWHAKGMMIACVNQKGGVGKTTLAVHLACWLNRQSPRVVLLDCDAQATASRWLGRIQLNLPTAHVFDADAIIETAGQLTADHEWVVADGAAGLSDCTRALLLVAGLAVLPCGATVPELEATRATVRILRNARRVRGDVAPEGLVLLTRMRHRGCRLVREAPQAAASLGLPVSRSQLTLLEATADAPGQGRTVWDLGRRAQRAADEMTAVCQEIHAHAQATANLMGDPHHGAAAVRADRFRAAAAERPSRSEAGC